MLDSRTRQDDYSRNTARPGDVQAGAIHASILPDRIMLCAVIALGLLSLLITRQYGESWDELKFYKYADSALQSYVSWPTTGQIALTGNTYDNYGPAYVMAASLGARALRLVLPWTESDLRHWLYFLSFLAGAYAFYGLAKRWLSPGAALGATALFVTQPLLWGHAFISPKDIPFLALFLLTIYFGLRFFDGNMALPSLPAERRTKGLLIVLIAGWLLFILLFFAGVPLIHAWLEAGIRAAAAGQQNLFARFASDIRTVAPEVYIQKYFVLFIRLRAAVFALASLALALLYQRHAPQVLVYLRRLLIPGILLGLTICVRILGPLAGLLVAIYGIKRQGRSALPATLAYLGIAAAAMYATWPYLWPNPIGHFLESIRIMAEYPWQGQVLFDGRLYRSYEIPRSYLPILLAIQLSEPVWILFALGLGLTIFGAIKKRLESRQLLWITALWFILPAAGFTGLRSPLYDNFRQVFFILPPVFMTAGLVFDQILNPKLRAGLIVICILPGVISGMKLHPYEYIYYNSVIGGEAGAFRRFEADYWGTSYRQAAHWLNQNAAPNSRVWADGPAHLLGIYLRPDIKLFSSYESERAEHYDFTVSTSRYDLDISSYPGAPVVYSISREGAILSVIKQP